MTSKQKKMLYRIITAFVLFVVLMVLEHTGVLEQSETSVTDRCLMKTF